MIRNPELTKPGVRLTREDLASLLYAKDETMTRNQCRDAVDELFAVLSEALQRDQEIMIRGFGTFSNHPRQGRKGVNPQNGARVWVPDTVVPGFRAGKLLNEAVKENVTFEQAMAREQSRKKDERT